MKIIIPGFQFAGIHAGIKDDARKKDLALIYSEEKSTLIDGVFTRNKVCAPPVTLCRKSIGKGRGRLVVVNRGIANACTGERGMRDAQKTQKEAARLFGLNKSEVFVCSTGKIGNVLPMGKLVPGLKKAKKEMYVEGFMDAARGIMTTDQFPKFGSVTGKIFGKKYTIAVMAKGAGMLRPDMATLLAYILTDLKFSRPVMARLFRKALDLTLNRVTVDGDTSTNDTVLMLANGRAGNKIFSANSREGRKIAAQMTELLNSMARKITLDGEGATKCCRVTVKGATNSADARKVAYAIGNSPLVKTALFGCDPNWGRIMAAIGYSGARVNPKKISVKIGSYWVARRGQASPVPQAEIARTMKKENVEILADLGIGNGTFFVFMSDLTYDYVNLNAEYHT